MPNEGEGSQAFTVTLFRDYSTSTPSIVEMLMSQSLEIPLLCSTLLWLLLYLFFPFSVARITHSTMNSKLIGPRSFVLRDREANV